MQSKYELPTNAVRTPITSPLPCYGYEYSECPQCAACPNVGECSDLCARSPKRIPMSLATFSLIPKTLQSYCADRSKLSAGGLQHAYICCYRAMYQKYPESGDYASGYLRKIQASCALLNCGTCEYILACMMGHQRRCSDTAIPESERAPFEKFRAFHLVGSAAHRSAAAYASICRDRYGSLAKGTLETIASERLSEYSLGKRFIDSEVTAALWVTNYKLRYGGNAYAAMYKEIELHLDPEWLAIEPSYTAVLNEYFEKPRGRDALSDHRSQVIRVMHTFKTRKTHQCAIFMQRQEIMPIVVQRVCTELGYSADNFEVKDKPVVDIMAFWANVARAIQQYELILFLEGAKSIYNEPL